MHNIQPFPYAWAHRRPWLARREREREKKSMPHLPRFCENPGQFCSLAPPATDVYGNTAIQTRYLPMIQQTLFCSRELLIRTCMVKVLINSKHVIYQGNLWTGVSSVSVFHHRKVFKTKELCCFEGSQNHDKLHFLSQASGGINFYN